MGLCAHDGVEVAGSRHSGSINKLRAHILNHKEDTEGANLEWQVALNIKDCP